MCVKSLSAVEGRLSLGGGWRGGKYGSWEASLDSGGRQGSQKYIVTPFWKSGTCDGDWMSKRRVNQQRKSGKEEGGQEKPGEPGPKSQETYASWKRGMVDRVGCSEDE